MKVWLDGKVLGPEQALVSATDHGLTVGDGVFETCKVVDGQAFALNRHLRRLQRSCEVLGLSSPAAHEVRSAVEELLGAGEPIAFGRLRITLTGGAGPLGSGRDDVPPTLVLAATPASRWPSEIAVVTVPWTRNERSAVAGAKTTSYAENVVALHRAHAQGAHEAIFANTLGMLCEGTGSNIVIDLDGQLLTPSLTSGCLAGITRELLLEWAAQEGLEIAEKDVPISALEHARDVLLTSSTRDVQRVQRVDGREVEGTELGRAAIELFSRRERERIDP